VDATLPTLWLMATLVASVTLQLKVELSPTVMLVGLAKKELMVGAVVTGFTVIVVVAVTLPEALVAVRV